MPQSPTTASSVFLRRKSGAKGASCLRSSRPLAHQFEAGGEGRSPRRAPVFGVRQEGQKIIVERGPVERASDKSLQRVARIAQRPDAALFRRIMDMRRLGAHLRVGAEEIVDGRLPERLPRHDDRLRRAAPEDITAKLVALHQRLSGKADRLQALKTGGEVFRQHLSARLVILRRLRQQQAGLQIGEPGRHDEIIGRKLQPEAAGHLHEGEILLCQSQYRDARQIDPAAFGQASATGRAAPQSRRHRPRRQARPHAVPRAHSPCRRKLGPRIRNHRGNRLASP